MRLVKSNEAVMGRASELIRKNWNALLCRRWVVSVMRASCATHAQLEEPVRKSAQYTPSVGAEAEHTSCDTLSKGRVGLGWVAVTP